MSQTFWTNTAEGEKKPISAPGEFCLTPAEKAEKTRRDVIKNSERRVDYSEFLKGYDSADSEGGSEAAAASHVEDEVEWEQKIGASRQFMSMNPSSVKPIISEEPTGIFEEEGDEEDRYGDDDIGQSGRDLLRYALTRSERRDESDYY